MTNRERAITDATVVADFLDERGVLGSQDSIENALRLGVALVFALADISEWLEEINEILGAIYIDGVGVGR